MSSKNAIFNFIEKHIFANILALILYLMGVLRILLNI